MLLTESDSGAPCILLSLVSKSWKSFNPSQLLTDLNQKTHSFKTLELHDNHKCKWIFHFWLLEHYYIISDFSFNSICVTYNFIWINDYEYREPLLSWDYSRDLGQQ